MKALLLCSFFLAAASALPPGDNDLQFKRLYVDAEFTALPKDVVGRITSGQEAVPHSIPYQVYLVVVSKTGTRWLCGGSLISPKHVLTAGHCVDGGVEVYVYLGAHNVLENEDSRVIVTSRQLICHEDFNKTAISNDIGLVVFDQEVQLSDIINTVSLPSRKGISTYTGANVRVSGWGRLSGPGATSAVLMEVNSTVISNSQCRSTFRNVIDSQICIAGYYGVGTCSGDSGGPLISGNDLIGIVSYGATGCPAWYPSAFTRVTSFLDWIEEKTGLQF